MEQNIRNISKDNQKITGESETFLKFIVQTSFIVKRKKKKEEATTPHKPTGFSRFKYCFILSTSELLILAFQNLKASFISSVQSEGLGFSIMQGTALKGSPQPDIQSGLFCYSGCLRKKIPEIFCMFAEHLITAVL